MKRFLVYFGKGGNRLWKEILLIICIIRAETVPCCVHCQRGNLCCTQRGRCGGGGGECWRNFFPQGTQRGASPSAGVRFFVYCPCCETVPAARNDPLKKTSNLLLLLLSEPLTCGGKWKQSRHQLPPGRKSFLWFGGRKFISRPRDSASPVTFGGKS